MKNPIRSLTAFFAFILALTSAFVSCGETPLPLETTSVNETQQTTENMTAPESEGEEEGASAKTTSAELGVCCFSPDGKTMYFTYSCPVNGQDLGAKIYTSTRASGEWGEGQELKLFSDSSIA